MLGDAVDARDGGRAVGIAERGQAGGDRGEQLVGLGGVDDPVALATAQVQAHVALVVGRMAERRRLRPVDPAQLQARGELERHAIGQRLRDRAARAARDRRAQAPDRPGRAGAVGGQRAAAQHRLEHLRQQVGPRAVDVHPDGRGDDHVAVAGQRGEHAPERGVDLHVDVLQRAAQPRALAPGGWLGELGEIPELVPGEVRGAERQPGEVVAITAQQLDGGVRDPGGRGDELGAQREQLARGGAAEDLRRVRALAVAAGQLRARLARQRPARQHDAVAKAPAAHVGPAPRLGRPALVGVDGQRPPALPREALPDRRRRGEGGHVARALRAGVPLKRIEETVVGQLHAAVEGVERARGEVLGRRVERDPPAARDETRQDRQPPGGQHPVDERDARRVELQHADHATVTPSTGTVSPPAASERRAASSTHMTAAPSAAVASGPGSSPRSARP